MTAAHSQIDSTTDGLTVPDEQRARQACASLGGHLFQAVRAASEWVQLGPDARLLIEVAEDYAVLAQGALSMTQTKQEFSAAVTLRSDGVRKALAGLFSFQTANPELAVSLAYLTTARTGVEAKAGLPDSTGGIDYWRQAARGADIEPLRALLLATQTDKALLAFVRDADAETLRARLIAPVQWLIGSPALAQATDALDARLRALALDRTGFAGDGERARPFLVHRILQTAVAEDRVLTHAMFERLWEQATTMTVSFAAMRQMSAALAGGMPGGTAVTATAPLGALSRRTAPRRPIVDELRAGLDCHDVLWIHGSSGLGKTQLARLLGARGNGRWAFVAMKGYSDDERAVRLRDAIAGISRDDFAGLILDDVPVPAAENIRHWIAAAALEIAAAPRARIVVTSERAPLAMLRQALAPLRLIVRHAPYLSEEDVADIVTAGGGDAATWSNPIYYSCGGGHPLLVDARVAGLASKSWPAGELLDGLMPGDGASEIGEVRQEISLRLLGELSSDAHRLLLRLAALIGAFDRAMVDAVAAIPPAIPTAGALFNLLTGPWIEAEGANRYRLSPLLVAAAQDLSESERGAIHPAVVGNLVARNPLPGDLLQALVLHTMLSRDMRGFMFIAQAVMTSPNRSALAGPLLALMFMKPGDDGVLLPEHPGISIMLRLAQLVAALGSPGQMMVEKLLEAGLAEGAKLPDKLAYANQFNLLTMVLSQEALDLPATRWLPLLARYRALIASGKVPFELLQIRDAVDLGGLDSEQFLFLMRSKTDTVARLETLFEALDGIEPAWRHRLLQAASILFKGPPLFIQSAWSSEAIAGTLDAARAERGYGRLAEQASGWGEDEVAIECQRGQAVILDEYLGQRDAALAVLDAAEARYPGDARLTRSRATVLGHMGRHAEERALLGRLEADYSAEEPVERLLMMRSAGISAAKIGDHREAARLFDEAFSLALDHEHIALGPNVRPGLLMDAAVMDFLAERPSRALAKLRAALEGLEALVDDGSPEASFARHALDHVCQWASARIEGKPFAENLADRPGVCSTLKPSIDAHYPAAPRTLHQTWYLLARLEALAGLDDGGEDGIAAALNEREARAGIWISLAVPVAASRVESAATRGAGDALFAALARFAWASGVLLGNRGEDLPGAIDAGAMTGPSDWGEAEILVARSAVSSLIGHLVLAGQSAAVIDTARRARRFSIWLGALVPETELGPPGQWDVFAVGLSALRRLQDPTPLDSAERLLQTSTQLFIWLRHVGHAALDRSAFAAVLPHWLGMARNARAIFSNPRLAVPAIDAAAVLPPGIAALARLIEAGTLASSQSLPPFAISMLQAARGEASVPEPLSPRESFAPTEMTAPSANEAPMKPASPK